MKKVVFLLCVLLLMSASCQQAEERLTDEQIEALREEYPTIEFNGSLRIPEDVFDGDSNLKTADVILLVEITTPLERVSTRMAVDAEQTFFDNVNYYYYRVRVLEIIAINHNEVTRGNKTKNEDLDSNFAYEEIYILYPDWGAPELIVGDKLLVTGVYSNLRDSIPVISTSTYSSYYIIDDKYILSMTTASYVDNHSGETYKDFRKKCVEFAEKYKWDTKEGVK